MINRKMNPNQARAFCNRWSSGLSSHLLIQCNKNLWFAEPSLVNTVKSISFLHHMFSHSFIHSFSYSWSHLFVGSFSHSCVHLNIHSFIHVSTHSLALSVIHTSTHSFICSVIHVLIHSLIQQCIPGTSNTMIKKTKSLPNEETEN